MHADHAVVGLVRGKVPSNCSAGVPVCMGIDEAGRGPVLGDMVYGAAYWPIAENEALSKLGFADSKILTAARRAELFKLIVEGDSIGYVTHSISAAEISAKMQKRSPISLNKLSHDSAAGLVKAALADGVHVEEVYVDTVGSPEWYENFLTTTFQNRIKFTVTKKADSLFPVVSAASICAKVTRDVGLESWSFAEQGFESTCPLGSGYPGDALTKTWLQRNMDPVFGYPDIVRFSWQTTATILEKTAVSVTWAGDELGAAGISSFFTADPVLKRCPFFKKMRLDRPATL